MKDTVIIKLDELQVQAREKELSENFNRASDKNSDIKTIKADIKVLVQKMEVLSREIKYKQAEIPVDVDYNNFKNGIKRIFNKEYGYEEFESMTDSECDHYPPRIEFEPIERRKKKEENKSKFSQEIEGVTISAYDKAEKTYKELTKVVLGPPDVKKPVDTENEPIGLVNAIKNSSIETINEAAEKPTDETFIEGVQKGLFNSVDKEITGLNKNSSAQNVDLEEHKPLFELGDYVKFLPSRDYIDPLLPTKLKILTGKIVVMRPEIILIGSGSRATEEFVYTIQDDNDKHVYDVIEMNVFQKLGRAINTIAEAAPKEDENIF